MRVSRLFPPGWVCRDAGIGPQNAAISEMALPESLSAKPFCPIASEKHMPLWELRGKPIREATPPPSNALVRARFVAGFAFGLGNVAMHSTHEPHDCEAPLAFIAIWHLYGYNSDIEQRVYYCSTCSRSQENAWFRMAKCPELCLPRGRSFCGAVWAVARHWRANELSACGTGAARKGMHGIFIGRLGG